MELELILEEDTLGAGFGSTEVHGIQGRSYSREVFQILRVHWPRKTTFEANSFDAYTIATGIRNVPRIDLALSEAFRVLKRGGRFLCLEFSEVDMPMLDRLYDEWSMKVIPQMGKLVSLSGRTADGLVL